MPSNLGMLLEHQEAIRKNFTYLTKLSDLDGVLTKLQNKGIFSEEMTNSIRRLQGKERARKLFIDIQKRGPQAFEALINSLIEDNQRTTALLLDPTKQFITESRPRQHSGAQPFQLASYSSCQIEDIKHLHDLHPSYNISLRDAPKIVKVKLATDFVNDEPVEHTSLVYRTRSKNRGLVKIINIHHVPGYNERRGSNHDVDSLESLFTQIGMEVDISTELTTDEITSELHKFVSNKKLITADIAILIIMSHGGIEENNDEFFCGKDGNKILSKDVEELFNNRNCVYMQNKPKVLIFQLCRGRKKDDGVSAYRIETDGVPNNKLPIVSDLLIIHSTLQDYVAHRDIYVGSWFIQILCEIFMNHAHNKHIEDMLKLVHNQLHLQRSASNTIQTAEYINRHFNHCYFNPGIYMENGNLCHFH